MTTAAAAQLTATVRLLLQVRLLLTAIALLLLPRDRLTVSVFITVCAFAFLTWLLIRYWERLAPHLQRRPSLIGADALVAAIVLALDGPTGPFFMATVLTSTLTGVLFGRVGVALMAVLQVCCYYAALLSQIALDDFAMRSATFQVLIMHPALYAIAGFVGLRLRTFFDQLASEQEARQSAELIAAAAEERTRLARDMHDSVAKTLRGAAMAAQALPLWIERDPERAATTAHQVAQAAEVAAKEARDLIGELRSEASGRPIADLVRNACDEWAAESSVTLELELTSEPTPLLAIARHEIVSVLREALTNVDRHAGAASVRVSLDTADSHVYLRIKDDGDGFDPGDTPTGHYGLVGMRERARHASGELDVTSSPGAGTEVTVRLPLCSPQDNPADSPTRQVAEAP
ncbi:signal transduction histidine kinase [Murinocardiopsis flavida]|uniref:Signal transduction histidine kinase n=1 Tax=Murinocardiopsis flavida TaxID=645275 RepID=A0A2P8D258_9ACTN|nr:ATP-binding protein [Murinocardiopsis flavida]PSK91313.1 signal transduction histidine kinase [Murinocardiopsis flavida]